MGLRDVTSVVFERSAPDFNEHAALEAYHLVAKMDEETAQEFVFHVANEVLERTIEANREPIQKQLDRTIAKMLVSSDLDSIAKGLNKDQRAVLKRELLSAISKADDGWGAEQEREHPRGEGGRFRSVNAAAKLSAEDAKIHAQRGLDIPTHPDWDDMSREAKERYRAQYAQVAQHIGDLGGFKGSNDVTLHYDNGETKKVLPSRTSVAAAINPHEGVNVNGVTVEPYKAAVNGMPYNLTRALGTGARGAAAGIDAATTPQFANAWSQNSGPDKFGHDRLYGRIKQGSDVLSAANVGNSRKLKLAADFGSWVGNHGPQAEQVFGPPTRKLAYRYRGVEKRPDAGLVKAYAEAVNDRKAANGRHPSRAHAEAAVPTWSEREAGREEVINYLNQKSRRPSKTLRELHLKAGHTPPSEGVLLNADGQIVTQAVGYGDDWYLPFNLKNLKSLKGGEYIRTRASGGLTSEDIYTGLMSGARRVTVVSDSGVFSVEFDKDFRGGRRYNDKALRMSHRYKQLLDAVQSGKVQRHDITPERRAMLMQRVNEVYGTGLTPAQRQEAFQAVKREFVANPAEIDAEIADARDKYDQAEQRRGVTREELSDLRNDVARLESEKQFNFQLNGLGYQAAQDALAEQFPYYIASRESKKFMDYVGGQDKGYVRPGDLKSTHTELNWHNAGGPNSPWGGGRRGHAAPTPEAPQEPEAKAETKAAPSSLTNREDVARKVAEFKRSEAVRNASTTAFQHNLGAWAAAAKDEATDEDRLMASYAKMSEPDFKLAMSDPRKAAQLRDALDGAGLVGQKDAQGRETDFGRQAREFATAVGPKTGGAFDYIKATQVPEQAYDVDASDTEKIEAKSKPSLVSGEALGKLSPAELTREAQIVAAIERSAQGENPQENRILVDEALKGYSIPESRKQALTPLINDRKEREKYMRQVKITEGAPRAETLAVAPESKPAGALGMSSSNDLHAQHARDLQEMADDWRSQGKSQEVWQEMMAAHHAFDRSAKGEAASPDDHKHMQNAFDRKWVTDEP